MAKQIGDQELIETWASEGDVSEPFLSKKRQGWLFQEQPASSIANWLVNIQGQKLNHLLKNGVSEWSTNTDYTRGAIVKHANTAWRALRDNTASEPAPGNMDWAEVSTLPILRAPDLISPVDGASGVTTTVTLTASGYAPVYSVDSRDYREFEVDVSGGDFSTPIRTNQVDADTWDVDPALDASAGYEWRCRDVSTRGDVSDWSVIEPFTTGANFITTPSITAPEDNATDITETPTFESSAFAVTGTTDTHVASYWRVYQGTTLVWETGRTTSDLESATIPSGILEDGETEYTVQVRHEGDTLGTSAWSTASTFTTLDTFTRVAQPSITSPLEAETDITETPTFESSAFSVVNGSDTHAASRWEVYDNADSLVWASGRDTINRTSITMPSGVLQDGTTTYKVRVQHEGESLGTSAWSDLVEFETQESFFSIFSGSFDRKIIKTNASNLTQDSSFSGHDSPISALAYGSNDVLYSGSISSGPTVRAINPTTMAEIAKFSGHTDSVRSLAYGTDGFVYSASSDGTVRKLNATTLAQVEIFSGHTAGVNAVVFGNDGFVYSGSNDGSIVKIDPSDMSEANSITPIGHLSRCLAFGTDGFLYTGSFLSELISDEADADVRKINPSTMEVVSVFSGHTDSVNIMAFGADGYLYTGSDDNTVRQLDPSTMEQVGVFLLDSSPDAICYGADDFIYVSSGTAYRRIDTSDMLSSGVFLGHSGQVYALAFSISIPDLLGFTA